VSHPIRRLNDLAECCVFVKQSVDPFHCDRSCDRHPFFRSYGARLPSSLTRFHSRALAQLCPPTCVGLRYGQPWEHLIVFLDTSFNRSASAEASTSLLLRADRHFQPATCLYSYVQLNLTTAGAGILNLLSIVYALRPRLRSRLTLGGRAFPRKPWVYGGQEFNLSYRYSCLHSHFLTLHRNFHHGFDALRTLPYQSVLANQNVFQSFGIPLIANHYRREIAR
jgi:hypothetical protein